MFLHAIPTFWLFTGTTGETPLDPTITYMQELTYSPNHFYLFLAKIAHCAAVAWKGYGNFEPFLPELILTRSNDICDYVGGCETPHHINPNVRIQLNALTREEYVIIEISLFANWGAPFYQVVAGKLNASRMSVS